VFGKGEHAQGRKTLARVAEGVTGAPADGQDAAQILGAIQEIDAVCAGRTVFSGLSSPWHRATLPVTTRMAPDLRNRHHDKNINEMP
jgi:hypothetical protein